MSILSSVVVRDTDDLQAIGFNFLVIEHANSSGSDRFQIFAVIAKLFVIARHKINSMWSGQLSKWFACASCVNGRSVEQIAGNKNQVWFFLQNLSDHAAKKAAVTDVSKMNVTDQCRRSSFPSGRQVRELHRRSRDSRPASVEHPVQSSQHGRGIERGYDRMEGNLDSGKASNAENDPNGDGRQEKEADKADPNGCQLVKAANNGVCVAKGKQGSCYKAHRQKTQCQLDPQPAIGRALGGREHPGFVEEKMGQKKNRLNH